jgi:uncharacterized membrane protein YgdD (TMEM256/DUF423 family)
MTDWNGRLWKIAAVLGALAVLLGAFGAHALSSITDDPARMRIWRTASLYHLVHSGVLLAAALHPGRPVWGPRLLIVGILVFSGSLYALALTGIGVLGGITPIGGLCFIAGWLALAAGK